MTTKRFRIVDSLVYRATLLQSQPRSIDRYIDYFGDGQPRINSAAPAK